MRSSKFVPLMLLAVLSSHVNAAGFDSRSCSELQIAASQGEAKASFTLAGEYIAPGGCGHNYRTAYRYLEIGARRQSPIEGLAPIAGNPEGVYLLASWVRKEKAIPEYSVDPSVMKEMTVTEVARSIEASRNRVQRQRPIPSIPHISVSTAYQGLVASVSGDEVEVDQVRSAVLAAMMALRNQGFSQASFELALYFHKSPFDQDQRTARDLLSEAAGAGHRSATVILGQAVEKGDWGFQKDIPLACAIYKSVGALGCPTSNPGKVSPEYQNLLRRLNYGSPRAGSYKGPPVPYMNTSPDGLWWVLENAFRY